MKNDMYELIKKIMTEHASTRDDDFKLYAWACYLKAPDSMKYSFAHALWHSKELKLPSYESVTRARRKVQELEPELRGKMYAKRHEKQEDYREMYGEAWYD